MNSTSSSWLSVRKSVIEPAALAAFRNDLLTDEHARLFVDEFRRDAKRLAGRQVRQDEGLRERLVHVETEFANLERNLLAGVLRSTLTRLLSDREAEKTTLKARLVTMPAPPPTATIPPAPKLMACFA